MSIYWEPKLKRWRFSFNRKIGPRGQRVRYRATKVLPKGWTQRQAEKFDEGETKRIYAEASGVEPARLKLAPAVQLYLDHRCPELANGAKAARDLFHLYDYIKDAYLDELPDVIQRYKKDARQVKGKKRVGKPLAQATLRNRLSYLVAAVRYARRSHGYGKGLPDYSEDADLPIVRNERQVYAKVPELDAFWKALRKLDDGDRQAEAAFTLAFYCGLRWLKELLTRRSEDIVRNRRDVWLDLGVTKSGEPVRKWVHPKARWALKYIPFTHGATYFYTRWRKAAEAIGRPDLRPHDLRHSLASDVVSRGGTPHDIMAALHDRTLKSVERYSHLYPDHTRKVLSGVGKGRR
jgi:integrase